MAAALAVSSVVLAQEAGAAEAPVDLVRAEPVSEDGTTFLAGREAARAPGQPDRFKIKGDFFLVNTGWVPLTVESVDISYPGSSVAAVTTLPTANEELQPGVTTKVRVFDGLYRELPDPLPPTIHIEINYEESASTTTFTYPLAYYLNDTHTGSQLFPALASDLPSGQYWRYGSRHIDDSHPPTQKPSTVADRYAYDVGVVRWDGTGWTDVEAGADGNQNGDYLVWEMPLYATDDGVVVQCATSNPDHSDPNTQDGTAINELWIQYGDEMVRYAHLKEDSVPASLCPGNPTSSTYVEDQDIAVAAGDLIGQVGNNGQSSGPHLHMSVHYRPDRSSPPNLHFDYADSRPQGFHNIRIASDADGVNDLGQNPAFHAISGSMLPSHTLFIPNPCGLDVPQAGATELARHGVPEACYQDRFDLDVQAGYRPVLVDGYDAAGSIGFNVVYRSGGDAPAAVVARHGLDGAEYQDVFNELTADGYRLHSIDSHLDDGVIRHNPVFEMRDGPSWFAYHQLTQAEHDQQVAAAKSSGFVPVRVAVTDPGSGPRWTALYEHAAVDDWEIVDSSAAGYQNAFNAEVAAGRIPIHVHGHSSPTGARIVGVFVDPVGGGTTAVHGVAGAGYQQSYNDAIGNGRLTRSVSGYEDGGQVVFAGVWRTVVDTAFTSTPPAYTNSTSASPGFAADDPFASYECSLDGAAFTTCSSPTPLQGLSEGAHTFTARAVDRDGVRDPSPASSSWTVDLTAPTVEITRPEPGFTYAHDVASPRDDGQIHVVGHVTVLATATDALSGVQSVEFTVNGVAVPASSVTQVGPSTWSFQFVPDQKGKNPYTIGWSATDAATNTAGTAVTATGVKTGP